MATNFIKYQQEANAQIWDFKLQIINELLAKCREEQQAFFYRLYPEGITEKNYNNCLGLISRTLVKNDEGRPVQENP